MTVNAMIFGQGNQSHQGKKGLPLDWNVKLHLSPSLPFWNKIKTKRQIVVDQCKIWAQSAPQVHPRPTYQLNVLSWRTLVWPSAVSYTLLWSSLEAFHRLVWWTDLRWEHPIVKDKNKSFHQTQKEKSISWWVFNSPIALLVTFPH